MVGPHPCQAEPPLPARGPSTCQPVHTPPGAPDGHAHVVSTAVLRKEGSLQRPQGLGLRSAVGTREETPRVPGGCGHAWRARTHVVQVFPAVGCAEWPFGDLRRQE